MRLLLLVPTLSLLLIACGDDRGPEKADSNVGSNAAAAGLGTLVYGLITKDENAVRNAVAVGAATATTTAVVEKSQENKKSGEWERVIGKENSDGLVALLHKDYRTARTQFEKGLTSDQAPFKRAAQWGMALVSYDTGDDAKLDAQLEVIAKSDPAIGDKGKAKDELTRLNAKLTELRKEYK
ncbi:MAG TPA: hypothetical protein VHX44_00670 [Planctomycetota bacterium]|jgi:hypothetical protein|nr:hypothetical protein [Planctomycetota bacterium]